MNLEARIAAFEARGFTRDTAAVNVLIEAALQTLFSRFPDTFVFFGGASLVLFYQSQRHSADLDLLISAAHPPAADDIRAAVEPTLNETAEALGFNTLQIESARTIGKFAKLAVKSDDRLLFTIDLTNISAVIKSEVVTLPLTFDDNPPISIAVTSRNLSLLFKAEAFLTRRTVKARDAFDIKLLLDSGSALTRDLKAHLVDGPAADHFEDPKYIAGRIAEVNARICRPELQPYLPDELYRALEREDFETLRNALKILFADWL